MNNLNSLISLIFREMSVEQNLNDKMFQEHGAWSFYNQHLLNNFKISTSYVHMEYQLKFKYKVLVKTKQSKCW